MYTRAIRACVSARAPYVYIMHNIIMHKNAAAPQYYMG